MKMDLPPIEDVDALFSMAAAMEREAARRYSEMAAQVRAIGYDDVAEVFEQLAREEAGHEQQIAAWAGRETGAPPRKEKYDWDMGAEVLGLDEDEQADPYTLTPYRALSIAVHNEERAFAFYSYIAAELSDPELRRYAEGLAREELDHAARLRPLRRQAYHAERGGWPPERTGAAARTPRDTRTFHELGGPMEARLAANLAALAERLRAERGAAAADTVSALAAESDEAAKRLGARAGERAEAQAEWRLRDALTELERAYDFYSRTAEWGESEDLVATAQELMSSSIGRLARLRNVIAQSRQPDRAGS